MIAQQFSPLAATQATAIIVNELKYEHRAFHSAIAQAKKETADFELVWWLAIILFSQTFSALKSPTCVLGIFFLVCTFKMFHALAGGVLGRSSRLRNLGWFGGYR